LDRRSFLRNLVPGPNDLEGEGSQSEEPVADRDMIVKIVADSCMSFQGCMCFSCREACPEDAILFSGLFEPVILDDCCTGCGQCIPVCPSSAISIGDRKHSSHQEISESNLIGLDDLLT